MKSRIISKLLLPLVALLFVTSMNAQTKKEKINVSLDLSYFQVNEQMPVLKATAKNKVEKKFMPTSMVLVNFFIGEESAEGFIGRARTNGQGVATIAIPDRFKDVITQQNVYTFIATVTNQSKYEDASAEIEITKARIEMELLDEDGVKSVHSKLLAAEDSAWIPVPESEIKFMVKRHFKDLPISDEEFATDEFGEAIGEFAIEPMGDSKGNILVGTKIVDNELYGNVEITKEIKWGVPSKHENAEFKKRALWGARDKTPIWLLIVPNLIILAVWGTIIFLVFQIFKIKRIGNS